MVNNQRLAIGIHHLAVLEPPLESFCAGLVWGLASGKLRRTFHALSNDKVALADHFIEVALDGRKITLRLGVVLEALARLFPGAASIPLIDKEVGSAIGFEVAGGVLNNKVTNFWFCYNIQDVVYRNCISTTLSDFL